MDWIYLSREVEPDGVTNELFRHAATVEILSILFILSSPFRTSKLFNTTLCFLKKISGLTAGF